MSPPRAAASPTPTMSPRQNSPSCCPKFPQRQGEKHCMRVAPTPPNCGPIAQLPVAPVERCSRRESGPHTTWGALARESCRMRSNTKGFLNLACRIGCRPPNEPSIGATSHHCSPLWSPSSRPCRLATHGCRSGSCTPVRDRT